MDKAKINFLETVDVELFKLYIHNLRWTAGLTIFLADEVRKYGNKVYNVRFDKMLQAGLDKYIENNPVDVDKWRGAQPHLSVSELTSKRLEIKLYGLKSSVYGGKDCFGNDKSANMPSGYSDYTIAYHWTDYPTIYSWATKEAREKEALYHSEASTPSFFYFDDNDNLRLKAPALADLLVEKAKDTTEKADALDALLVVGDDGLTEIERDRLEYERIKKEADRLRDKLPSEERSFFDIKAYAQWS